MNLRRRKPQPPQAYVGDHADKLSRVRGISHAQDPERPSAQDIDTYRSPIESINEASFPGWGRTWGRRRKRKG